MYSRRWMQMTNGTDLAATCRATEMDITMIGLQNAGKTSLLRVLAVRHHPIEACKVVLIQSCRAASSQSSKSKKISKAIRRRRRRDH